MYKQKKEQYQQKTMFPKKNNAWTATDNHAMAN